MTEAEWNACTDPQKMLEFLQGKASDRELRLFACACCRRIWHLLTDDRSRKAVEVAERFADGGTAGELGVSGEAAEQAAEEQTWEPAQDDDAQDAKANGAMAARNAAAQQPMEAAWVMTFGPARCERATAVFATCWSAALAATLTRDTTAVPYDLYFATEQAEQSRFLHDIFGLLPFCPVTLDHAWLTGTVTSLAQAIYEERAFDRMPILADALEDAGCNQQDVLSHLRGGGEHCRGCWAVDFVLRKE